MRAAGGLIGLVVVLGMAYFLYLEQPGGDSGSKPMLVRQMDLAGVRSDLLSLAQAERYYMASHGTYASLDELRQSPPVSNLPAAPRRGYSYGLEVDGVRHFMITARPEEGRPDLPVLSIDETMTIR